MKFDVTVKVRSEVPDGTVLPVVASVTTTEQSDPLVSNEVAATVAAAPQYDISKNSFDPLPEDGSDLNSGPLNFDNGRVFPCSFDAATTCTNIMYPLWVSTPNGGKGVSPAAEITFVEDLSPESFYDNPDITNHPNWSDDFRPRLNIQAGAGRMVNGVLGGASSDSVRVKGVRNSGTPQMSPAVGEDPGDGRYTITIDDADFSAWTVPTTTDFGQPLPNTGGGVINMNAIVEIPREALFALGTPNGDGSSTLRTVNSYTDFEVTDIAGQRNAADADTPRNNTRTADLRAALGQGSRGFGKKFIGIPSVTQNVTDVNLSPLRPWQTPYVIGEGQVIGSRLSISRTRATEADKPGMTALACDYWDPAQFTIEPGDYGPAVSPSNGDAVWNMSRNTGTNELRKVQYGVHDAMLDPTLPGGVSSSMPSNCEDSRIQWYNSLEEVPGGRQAVGSVRVLVTLTPDAQGNAHSQIGIALRSTTVQRDDNTIMPNYAGYRYDFHTVDDEPTWDAALAMPSQGNGGRPVNGDPSDYRADTHTGAFGDRVVSGALYSYIDKEVRNRAGDYVDTVQAFAGGQTADFRLIPRLYSVAPTARSEKVVVEDCIPAGFTIESSSQEYSLVRPTTATLTCADGATYVSWDLGAHDVSKSGLTLPAIEYTVSISRFAATGMHRNTARVLAQGDPASSNPDDFPRVTDTLDLRLDSSRGVFLEKAPLTPVTQVNLSGQPTNEPTSWEVRVGNMDTEGPRDMDVIDRLPVASGTAGNDFDGTMTFTAAEITDYGTSDPDQSRSMLYYTTAESFDLDPRAASNTQADGSVTAIWSATPPADLATVTGVRVVRTGAFDPSEQLAFRIDMAGVANSDGDTYRNAVQAVAHQGLGGLMVAAGDSRVVESTIGDFFWFDANGNGVQDSGEAGVPNATVKLTGTDDLGNPVELVTTTDEAGHYAFTVRSSDANGYTVAFDIPDSLEGYEFTGTRVGNDRGIDSDADGQGVVQAVIVGADASDLTVDAGIVKPEIDLVKSATPTSGLDAGNTVTYTFTSTNTGQTVLQDVALEEDAFTNADGTELALDAPPVLDTDASTGTPDELAPGETLVWTARYTLTSADLGGPIVNDARTIGASPRENDVEDTDSQTVTPKGVGAYTYSKVADVDSGAEVMPGDAIEYTVKVTHNGEGRVDGATVTDDLTAVLDDADYNGDVDATAGDAQIRDGVLIWTGDLADGAEVIITYSVTVKSGGDELLHNVVTSDDERGQCDDATGCETDHRIIPGSFTFSKTSDPASGSTVSVDDVVKYTVTVEHDGAGAVNAATITDDLSKVLDDAEYQGDVEATAGDARIDGSTLTWTGDLADGAEVTITYSVKVKAGGDDILHNTVTTADERGECDLTIGCETTHTLGEGIFIYSKTADPKSGSIVSVGDKVTYTLTVEHRGDGKVENANITDDLADVLDDADYNDDVEASSGNVRVKDGVLTWVGDLSHGDTVSITYSVTVKQGGDRALTNGVTSDDPRGACGPEGHCETTHDVPPGDGLAVTGAGRDMLWASGAATVLLLLGGGLLFAQRSRRVRVK